MMNASTVVEYEAAASLLLQFSEWLDTDGFGVPNPLLRSHTEMARDFLAGRAARALPRVAFKVTQPVAPAVLTVREIEVVQLVAEGKTNRQIATALGLSPLTVKSHLARIVLKLDLPTGDRGGLVGHCLRTGILCTADVAQRGAS